jgi:putative transposase
LDMPLEDVWLPGRYERLVTARSLICFWAVRELGVNMAFLARRFNVSIVAVSKSVKRGAEIAKKGGYELI